MNIHKLGFIVCVSVLSPVFADSTTPNIDPAVPLYRDGKLIIPRIDTPEQIGRYFDATFSETNSGAWHLDTYKQAGVNNSLAPVASVELVSVDSLPKQIFLRVQGQFSNGCGSVGQIYTRLENNTFKVIVNDAFDPTTAPFVSCIAALQPFEKSIALPVFGLKAGAYRYQVNGKLSGEFTLAADNTLPETSPVACTMDAKLCPDGSFVGRTPPSCAFAACPGS